MANGPKFDCNLREKWCFEHSDHMKAKNWEYYCLMNDSFLLGARTHRDKLKEHLAKEYDTNPGGMYVSIQWVMELLDSFSEQKTEHFGDAHGIGHQSTHKKHGQPVAYYVEGSNVLHNGYWDYIYQREVSLVTELTQLTNHHKTYVPIY